MKDRTSLYEPEIIRINTALANRDPRIYKNGDMWLLRTAPDQEDKRLCCFGPPPYTDSVELLEGLCGEIVKEGHLLEVVIRYSDDGYLLGAWASDSKGNRHKETGRYANEALARALYKCLYLENDEEAKRAEKEAPQTTEFAEQENKINMALAKFDPRIQKKEGLWQADFGGGSSWRDCHPPKYTQSKSLLKGLVGIINNDPKGKQIRVVPVMKSAGLWLCFIVDCEGKLVSGTGSSRTRATAAAIYNAIEKPLVHITSEEGIRKEEEFHYDGMKTGRFSCEEEVDEVREYLREEVIQSGLNMVHAYGKDLPLRGTTPSHTYKALWKAVDALRRYPKGEILYPQPHRGSQYKILPGSFEYSEMLEEAQDDAEQLYAKFAAEKPVAMFYNGGLTGSWSGLSARIWYNFRTWEEGKAAAEKQQGKGNQVALYLRPRDMDGMWCLMYYEDLGENEFVSDDHNTPPVVIPRRLPCKNFAEHQRKHREYQERQRDQQKEMFFPFTQRGWIIIACVAAVLMACLIVLSEMVKSGALP